MAAIRICRTEHAISKLFFYATLMLQEACPSQWMLPEEFKATNELKILPNSTFQSPPISKSLISLELSLVSSY